MLNPDQLRGLAEHTAKAANDFTNRVGIFDDTDPMKPIAQAAALAVSQFHDAVVLQMEAQ